VKDKWKKRLDVITLAQNKSHLQEKKETILNAGQTGLEPFLQTAEGWKKQEGQTALTSISKSMKNKEGVYNRNESEHGQGHAS